MRTSHAFSCTFAALLAGSTLLAGPIVPPLGPIGSTGKTLTEVEPRIAINSTSTPGDPIGQATPSVYKITQPGSYYLTANVIGESGKHGIEIASGDVTLDLNGFALIGTTGAVDGIAMTASGAYNVHVRNGSVTGWTIGVNLFGPASRPSHVTDVRAASNSGDGIVCGEGAIVTRCTTADNGGAGITCGSGSVITHCTAYNNDNNGIWPSFGSTVSDCSAYSNGSHGFVSPGGSSFVNCVARSNTSNGYNGNRLTITNCTAIDNQGAGFNVGASSSVRNSTATDNRLHGIAGTDDCRFSDNTCTNNNGGATESDAIFVSGSDNFIEGNHCTGSDIGVRVDGAGNTIIRNVCASNTNDWIIAANNIYGAVVDRRAPASAFVNGFAAPSTMGSTDPYANFSY